jgi:hypothetical protein
MARIIGNTRRHRGRRNSRRPSGGSGVHLITATFATGAVTSTVLRPKDALHAPAYFAAHDLLPPGFDGTSSQAEDEVNGAFATLDDLGAGASELQRAIVLLGHVPTAAALHALERHGASGRAHAGIARVAAVECAEMWCASQAGEAS